VPRPEDLGQQPEDHQQRQREGDHVRVQVAVEEGEVGHLGNGPAPGPVRQFADDARRPPVPAVRVHGQRLPIQHLAQPAKERADLLAQVAQLVLPQAQQRRVLGIVLDGRLHAPLGGVSHGEHVARLDRLLAAVLRPELLHFLSVEFLVELIALSLNLLAAHLLKQRRLRPAVQRRDVRHHDVQRAQVAQHHGQQQRQQPGQPGIALWRARLGCPLLRPAW